MDVSFDWQPHPVDGAVAHRYVRDGLWTDDSLGELLAAGLHEARANPFSVRSETRPFVGTLGEVDDLARRVAQGLRLRGIVAGDAVAFQLPNWVEAAATFYAIAYLGAIVVPIVHFYGPKETGYILRKTKVKAFITADRFGQLPMLENFATVREGGLDSLEWHAVVGTDRLADSIGFESLAACEPMTEIARVDPMAPALIAYTSGTTSDPKGVVHAHRTIGAEIRQLGAIQPGELGEVAHDVITGAPVGHGIGMLAALLLPVWRRKSIHLIDVWNPQRVLAAMLESQLSAGQGATIFLTGLLDHPDFDPQRHPQLMRQIGLGGAAVPLAVCERARALGIECMRSYGSTEHPSITGSNWLHSWEQRCATDGIPMAGVEIRLMDGDRNCEVGEPGEIWSRGPDCSFGYTEPAITAERFVDGWYRTGDIGVLDAGGALRITDRINDVIIRGGENISAVEVEELLMRLEGVAEVAVVAAPDARLGEHACAFLRMLDGAPLPSMERMQQHLRAAGLAKPKWPEELHEQLEFPRTPSGKVQKFRLRDDLRSRS